MTQRIALAEHSVTIRHAVRVSLSSLGFDLIEVATAPELLDVLRSDTITLCILNSCLPEIDANSLRDLIDELKVPILCLEDGESDALVAVFGSQQTQLQIPFESQVLVEAVCAMLNLDVPDQDLYAPYRIDVPLAHKGDEGAKNEDGQTVELTPISDEAESVDASADFDESVHTDTMSEREESKSTVGIVDQTLVGENESQSHGIVRTETYEVSPEQVLDAMAESADFDEADSVTNPIDALDAEAAVLPILEDPQNEPLAIDESRPPTLKIDEADDESPGDSLTPELVHDHDSDLVSDLERSPHQNASVAESQSATSLVKLPERLADLETLQALNVSKEVVERVAWAVVPVLAEAIIKEEVRKLLDSKASDDNSI